MSEQKPQKRKPPTKRRKIICTWPDCMYEWETRLPAPKIPKECPLCKRYLSRAPPPPPLPRRHRGLRRKGK